MCQCTPELKTPFCGKPGCEWPDETSSASLKQLVMHLEACVKLFEKWQAGIFKTMGIIWDGEPVEIVRARAALKHTALRTTVCHVCGCPTEIACADCRMTLSTTVFVCPSRSCRAYHEERCCAAKLLERWQKDAINKSRAVRALKIKE
jgi:hypothetical protein